MVAAVRVSYTFSSRFAQLYFLICCWLRCHKMNTMSLSGSDADKCEEPVVRNVYWLRFASEAEKMVQTTTGSDDFLMQLDNDNGFSCRIQSLETKFGTRIQRRLWHLPKIVTATEDILLLCPQCFLSQWESWCRNQCPEDSKTKKWGLWCPALISDSFENTMRCPWWRGLKLFPEV